MKKKHELISQLDNETRSHLRHIKAASEQNRLVIFVGAGVSATAGVPTWDALINDLKTQLPKGISNENDMLKIAQLFKDSHKRKYLNVIKEKLKYGNVSCNEVHEAIFKLRPCHIITTNYDELLEQYALNNNKQYYVVAKDEQLPANQGEKMIIKMHGDFKNENFVLTENDYLDYPQKFPLIRSFVLSLFSTKVVLFVGFSFNDINLKSIMHRITDSLDSKKLDVYLLLNQQRDKLTRSYLQKKGIRLLCLPNKLFPSKSESFDTSSSNRKTIALFQSLTLLNSYPENLIEQAIDFFEANSDQIRFWGKYLEGILPPQDRPLFYLSQKELTLYGKYEKWLDSIYKTDKTFSSFQNEYEDKLEWLIEKIIANRIFSINKRKIGSVFLLRKYVAERGKSSTRYVYDLDFKNIEHRLITLRNRTPKHTVEDLELPYLLAKMGNYYEAYLIYHQLAPILWKKRKYILYFICLYNIKISFSKTYEDLLLKSINTKEYIKEVNAINLKEILADLPITANIKEFLEKLVDDTLSETLWINSAKLSEKISEQRKNAEGGGFSVNSDIIKLLDEYEQIFFFCNENYMLIDCDTLCQESYIKMAEGILNSIMTPEVKFQSKLKVLYENMLPPFIFTFMPEELTKKLKQLTQNKLIPVEKGLIKRLSVIVRNIIEEAEYQKVTTNQMLLPRYLLNTIIMLNSIMDAPIIPGIYRAIIHYYPDRWPRIYITQVIKLYNRQKPTANEALEIIKCALNSKTRKYTSHIAYYIAKLASAANKECKVLDSESIKTVMDIRDLQLKSSFYWVFPEGKRTELIADLREHVNNIYDLCLMEFYTGAHIMTSELITKINNITHDGNSDNLQEEEQVCSLLYQMSCDDNYSELLPAIAKFGKTNKCYQFISNPIDYIKTHNSDEVQGPWLKCIRDDNKLKELLDNRKVRAIAIQFCNKNPWEATFNERIWRLMEDS